MHIDWPYEFPGAYWIDQEEEQVLVDVVRSGSMFRYYGLGEAKYVDAYEEDSRRFYDARYALGLNSGTGALITAMTAMGVGPGCEVIVPSFMWVASVAAVVQVNAIPVICEVDDSFCMDPKDLEEKITSRTKLILPIHMAGAPCDMDGLMEIATQYGIKVLEDCAQCNGGSFGGRKVGTIGDMGIFSLQLNKNMTAGEGGLLITDDQRLYQRAFSAHDMGLVRVDGRLATPEQWAISWGGGRRMTELCGSVAGVQLKKLPKIVDSMRASKGRIKADLEDVPGLCFRKLNDVQGDTGPFLILVFKSEQQAVIAAEKMKKHGLHNTFRLADYGMHIYYNIPSLVDKVPLSPAGNPWNLIENIESQYTYGKGTCPKSDDLFARSILVPIPSRLSEEQEQQAAQAIRQAVQAGQPAISE